MPNRLRSRPAAERLSESLRELSAEIEAADAVFNEVTDSDLLESLIYERSALLSRYKYLQKELRRLLTAGEK